MAKLPTPKECQIEFYFKRADIEKLLKNNPDAKGIIVKQQLVTKSLSELKNLGTDKASTATGKKEKHFTVALITAHADNRGVKKTKGLKAGDDPVEVIDGCPEPPGCFIEKGDE